MKILYIMIILINFKFIMKNLALISGKVLVVKILLLNYFNKF